jgi:cytochrome P450
MLIIIITIITIIIVIVKLIEYILESPYRHVKTKQTLVSPSLTQVALRVMFSKNHLSQEIMRFKDKFGEIFHCFVGLSGSTIVLSKPAHISRVLRQAEMFPKNNAFTSSQLHEFWGDNVLVVEGNVWKRQRSVMNKGFYDLEKFMNIFSKKIALCLDQWDNQSPHMSRNHIGSTTFPTSDNSGMKVFVRPFMQKMTLDVLGCTVFGYDFMYLNGEKGEYLDAYNYVMGEAFNIFRTLLQILNRLPGWIYPPNTKIYNAMEKFDELAYELIGRAKQRVEQRRHNSDHHNEEDTNLLELMIESTAAVDVNEESEYSSFTDKELRDNVCVLFVAGHETTAMVLSFCLYALAHHPEIQEKARAQVLEVVGSAEHIPTYKQLQNMEYISYVINETMRMWPPISILNGRITKKDEVFDDYKIPKGSNVQVFIYGVHHSKEIWKDPEVFRPERFEPAESKTRPAFSFIPFSAGPRVCIGNNFSLYEMKLFLSMLLQRYSIHLPEDVKQEYPPRFDRFNLVISPTNDLSVVFKKI